MKTQAALGWMGPNAEDVIVTNRCGSTVAVGDILQLDRRLSDAASTTNVLGTSAAGVANGVTPVAAFDGLNVDTFGVVQTGAIDDQKCRLRLTGYCDRVALTAAVTLANARGHVTAAARTVTIVSAAEAVAGTIRKCVFLPLTATAGTSTDGWFNGITGFGGILTV